MFRASVKKHIGADGLVDRYPLDVTDADVCV